MTKMVEFTDVTKRYPRGGARYPSLRQDISEGLKRAGMRIRGQRPQPRGTLALEDVSFSVSEGESLAIVGPNGAGKTTALKLISRISYPTQGRVAVKGRVAALIEVSSGVHPELTARENIWLYGRILGMSRAQIRDRFSEIVDFAELSHVLDRPVKFYSSGMQLRLGFSIASHLDPDVFLVDEALAVGDAGFQAKCVERMTTLVSEGKTLLFVSHNLPAAESICERGIFLHEGRVMFDGTARDAIAQYMEWVENRRASGEIVAGEEGPLRVTAASCHALDGEERYRFEPGEGIVFRMRFEGDHPLERPHVSVGITDGRPGSLISCSMLADGEAPEGVGTSWECVCTIDKLPLRPRLYQVYAMVHGPQGLGKFLKWNEITSFRVSSPSEGRLAPMKGKLWGPVDVPYRWTVTDVPLEKEAL